MHHLLIKWCLLKIYNLSFIPEFIKNIGNYVISPILCIFIPIGMSMLYKTILYKIKDKDNDKNKIKYKDGYKIVSA